MKISIDKALEKVRNLHKFLRYLYKSNCRLKVKHLRSLLNEMDGESYILIEHEGTLHHANMNWSNVHKWDDKNICIELATIPKE